MTKILTFRLMLEAVGQLLQQKILWGTSFLLMGMS